MPGDSFKARRTAFCKLYAIADVALQLPNLHYSFCHLHSGSQPTMASATKTVASLPLYTVVALFGFLTEVFMRLVGNVAGERCADSDHVIPCMLIADRICVDVVLKCSLNAQTS